MVLLSEKRGPTGLGPAKAETSSSTSARDDIGTMIFCKRRAARLSWFCSLTEVKKRRKSSRGASLVANRVNDGRHSPNRGTAFNSVRVGVMVHCDPSRTRLPEDAPTTYAKRSNARCSKLTRNLRTEAVPSLRFPASPATRKRNTEFDANGTRILETEDD